MRHGPRLRHLGVRREQLITEIGSQIQQMRDLLECVWPAALETARQPFRSVTWMAAVSLIVGRDGGDFGRTRRLGAARIRAGGAARDHPPRQAETLPAPPLPDRELPSGQPTASADIGRPAAITGQAIPVGSPVSCHVWSLTLPLGRVDTSVLARAAVSRPDVRLELLPPSNCRSTD